MYLAVVIPDGSYGERFEDAIIYGPFDTTQAAEAFCNGPKNRARNYVIRYCYKPEWR